eukprot:270628_1
MAKGYRRGGPVFSKGVFVEYQYNGSTVTGKIFKKSAKSTDANPIWIITPCDRRRRNEDISELSMGKVITEAEAWANRAPKLKPDGKAKRGTSPINNSDGSLDLPQAPGKRRSGRTTPSENSKTSGSSGGKRNSDDSNGSNKGQKKGVSFSQQDSNTSASNNNKKKTSKTTKKTAVRVGTRSKGGTTEMMLLPDEFPKKKPKPKMKRIKKDENVTIVKMLTGTLYMYRRPKPRAEFIRSK